MCKNFVIFWGGRGGGLEGPKKDYVIFEWSLKELMDINGERTLRKTKSNISLRHPSEAGNIVSK